MRRCPDQLLTSDAAAALGAAVLLPSAAMASTAEPVLRLAGRMHPVLVHFPIALLMVGALLELARMLRRRPPAADGALACIALGALGAAAAAGAGWMNAGYESHPAALASTLETHRWLGVSTACLAAMTLALALAARSSPRASAPYRLAAIAAAVLVGVTGHFGGSMVHGEGYLWKAFEEGGRGAEAAAPAMPPRPPPPDATLSVAFASDLRPTFEARCIECHGAKKQKGDLRLDDPGHLFAGPEELWVVVPGDPDASEIIRRLERGAQEKGHMPPKGERVSAETIALLRKWIEEGAYWTTPGGRLEGGAPASRGEGAAKGGQVGGRVSPAAGAPRRAAAPDSAGSDSGARALRAKGARIEPVSSDSTDLDANLSLGGGAVGDDDLAHLEPLAGRLAVLDLSGTSVSDAGLSRLLRAGTCARLKRLVLTDTAVSDACLEALAALPMLESLTLVGTKVTDAGVVAVLGRAASLERVYLWRTGVTAAGAESLRAARPGLNVFLDSPSLGAPDAPAERPK